MPFTALQRRDGHIFSVVVREVTGLVMPFTALQRGESTPFTYSFEPWVTGLVMPFTALQP